MTETGANKVLDLARLKDLEAKLDTYKSTLTEIYEQYDQKLEELSLVRRMGDAFRSTMSLEALSRSLLETVAHEVAVDRLALLLSDSRRPEVLALRSAYWSDEEKFAFHQSEEASSWPLKTLSALNLGDGPIAPLTIMSADSSYDPLGRPDEEPRSLVFLPLMSQHRRLGLLALSRPARRPFAPEDERMLAIMGDQASAALANVLLFDDLSKVNLRLTQSERRARQVSNYMQRLLETANDAILTLDERGRVTYANRKAEQWGWTKKELLRREFRAFLADSPELAAWTPGGPPPADRVFEAVLVNAAGDNRDVLLSTSRVDWSAPTPLPGENPPEGRAWMVLASDLTERKQLERQLIHSEKLASIGLLAAGVAHEVGNPLSAISGYAQILEFGGTSPEESREYLTAILNQTARIQKILKELLDYSRPSRGLMETIDLGESLPRILSMLAGQRAFNQVKIAYELDEEHAPHSVTMDRDHLTQIVIIIAMNAAQAMKNGGRFNVCLAREPGGIILRLADDGPGIPEDIRPRVFDPFFTTKSPGEGTGLGLAICQRIVDSYHGRISLESAPGQGTAFTIKLPEGAAA